MLNSGRTIPISDCHNESSAVRTPSFSSELVSKVQAGHLIAFGHDTYVGIGLRLSSNLFDETDRPHALALSSTAFNFKVPEIIPIHSRRVLDMDGDFSVELSERLDDIEPSSGGMKRNAGCLAVSGRDIGLYAHSSPDGRQPRKDLVCVNIGTGEIIQMPDHTCVEVRGWRLRLPSTAPGVPGRVVVEWPRDETPSQAEIFAALV